MSYPVAITYKGTISHQERIGETRPPDTNGVTRSKELNDSVTLADLKGSTNN